MIVREVTLTRALVGSLAGCLCWLVWQQSSISSIELESVATRYWLSTFFSGRKAPENIVLVPVLSDEKGSKARTVLQNELASLLRRIESDRPLVVGVCGKW